jgi:hypothetical protein
MMMILVRAGDLGGGFMQLGTRVGGAGRIHLKVRWKKMSCERERESVFTGCAVWCNSGNKEGGRWKIGGRKLVWLGRAGEGQRVSSIEYQGERECVCGA